MLATTNTEPELALCKDACYTIYVYSSVVSQSFYSYLGNSVSLVLQPKDDNSSIIRDLRLRIQELEEENRQVSQTI